MTTTRTQRLGYGSIALTATWLALGFSACKKDAPATQGAPAGSAEDKATSAARALEPDLETLAYAKKQLETAYAGTHRDPPTTAPKPAPGKSVWIISPGQAGESASIPTNAAKEAGEAIGWKMTIFDGKLDPSTYGTGIRQAIAAKADGIILDAIDCPWVKQALVEAKAAHVKTVAFNAIDCNDPSMKGEALYDGQLNTGPNYPDYPSVARAWGATKADWLIVETGAKAKLIDFKQDEFLIVKYIREGFLAEFAKCKSCSIVKTVDFTMADFGAGLQQKTQGAILQHPEANAVHVPYDSAVFFGIGNALVESGRNDQLAVIAGEGFPSNIQLIRDNKGPDAANAFPSAWIGWASVDTLNSVFNGQKPQDSGIGWQIVDRQHNLPAAGHGYEPPKDFRTAYRKAWGTSR